MDKIVNYVMKFKFVVKFGVDGRTKGDIEALADARRALKNHTNLSDFYLGDQFLFMYDIFCDQ